MIALDQKSLAVNATIALDDLKVPFEICHMIAGKQLLYGWCGENILSMDPAAKTIKGTYTAEVGIRPAAIINGDIYIGHLAHLVQLAGNNLEVIHDYPTYNAKLFTEVPN